MQRQSRKQTRNTLEFDGANSKVFLEEQRQALRVRQANEYALEVQAWTRNTFKNKTALALTLTLAKPKSQQDAEAALIQYNKMLDRIALGGASYRGAMLRTLWIEEGGGSTKAHRHYHGVVEVPEGVDVSVFAQQCLATWQEKIRIAGRKANKVEWVYDLDGWVKYITKGWSKDDRLDYLVLHATRLDEVQNYLH